MSDESKTFTVRLGNPESAESLRKFAQDVSAALVRLAKRMGASDARSRGRRSPQSSGATSFEIQLVDPATGDIVFLPGVRFLLPKHNDTNTGFELDISGDIGVGIGGTVQGYTLNYGKNGGEKLTAGLLGNNEDPAQPRMDVGFKVKRGASIEMYASAVEGAAPMPRDGQLRMTCGPSGFVGFYRYAGGDRWECIGGMDANGRLAVGWKNSGFPGTSDMWAAPKDPIPHPLSVYGETGGTGAETSYTKTPVATISKTGVVTCTGLSMGGKTFTAKLAELADGTQAYVLASD